MSELETTLAAHLANAQSGWSMGSFGAIAEFMQDAGDPCDAGPLSESWTEIHDPRD